MTVHELSPSLVLFISVPLCYKIGLDWLHYNVMSIAAATTDGSCLQLLQPVGLDCEVDVGLKW